MKREEDSIQERLWKLYEAYRSDDAVMFHIENEGIRGHRERAKFKRMGGVKGVADFFCGARGRSFFLELKRAKGKISDEQFELAAKNVANGISTLFAYSLEQAVKILQHEGVLRSDIKFSIRPENGLTK
jgi:hypothetical protein